MEIEARDVECIQEKKGKGVSIGTSAGVWIVALVALLKLKE